MESSQAQWESVSQEKTVDSVCVMCFVSFGSEFKCVFEVAMLNWGWMLAARVEFGWKFWTSLSIVFIEHIRCIASSSLEKRL